VGSAVGGPTSSSYLSQKKLVKKFLFKKIYYLSSALYFDYLMQKALDQ
jgi:hypothetical protein